MTVSEFMLRVTVATTGCWEFRGSERDGYPRFRENGKWIQASHWAYQNFCGDIPLGHHVLHRCDNTKCVKGEHLFSGTHRENMQDRNLKGRHAYGIRNGRAKLTEAKVLEIRALAKAGLPYRTIAKQLDVPNPTVVHTVLGRYWKHLPGILPRRGHG